METYLATHHTQAVQLISQERNRQVESEGWTPQHDSEHHPDTLAKAAACYATPKGAVRQSLLAKLWPFAWQWWKPAKNPESEGERIRELIKAGALIAAEIDRRLKRAERNQLQTHPYPAKPELSALLRVGCCFLLGC